MFSIHLLLSLTFYHDVIFLQAALWSQLTYCNRDGKRNLWERENDCTVLDKTFHNNYLQLYSQNIHSGLIVRTECFPVRVTRTNSSVCPYLKVTSACPVLARLLLRSWFKCSALTSPLNPRNYRMFSVLLSPGDVFLTAQLTNCSAYDSYIWHVSLSSNAP